MRARFTPQSKTDRLSLNRHGTQQEGGQMRRIGIVGQRPCRLRSAPGPCILDARDWSSGSLRPGLGVLALRLALCVGASATGLLPLALRRRGGRLLRLGCRRERSVHPRNRLPD